MVEQTGKPARGKAARKRPITRHPLFPAIVALWGAALFGIVALAIKPAALPALVAAVAGAMLALVLVRRIANPQPAAAAEPAAGPDETPLWSELKNRRRELLDDETSEPAPADPAPVVDRELQALDIAEVAMEPLAAPVVSAPAAKPAEIAEPGDVQAVPPLSTAAQRIAGAELEDLSHVELLERLAISLQRRGHQTAALPSSAAETSEPPVVFPARSERNVGAPAQLAAQSPADTEKALRDALSALQRMSGTA